ncbi:MotA/TolQ/ExbB proton channel family protein [Jannaschia rubra]|uniref:MotA/TolQ/ExbB proton channel family protein n=1 Tax=Jannaschia rubra TaxID=282197 RepID=UPI0024929798|nr:MotA/TolQ/ExbB proton channel family protein [Jannaschia rubra]
MSGLAGFGLPTLIVFALLGALSVTAVATGIWKMAQFHRLGVGRAREAETILDDWLSGEAPRAVERAASRSSSGARILQAVFSALGARPDDPRYAEELGRQTALSELAALASRMRLLEVVVQAAPMLGLLGTVIGMIDAFAALSVAQGAVDPSDLAGGIWTALTTTAAGLAIALLAYFIANLLESRIEAERTRMESLLSAAIHGRVDGGPAAWP